MPTIRPSLVVALVLLATFRAQAHDVRGTAVLLDVGTRVVDVELQLPLSELALALQRQIGRAHGLLDGNEADELGAYVRAHLAVRSAAHAPMALDVGAADIARIDDGDALVVHARATAPPDQSARQFELAYDGIADRVMSHDIFVFVRRDLENGIVAGKPELVGLMHYQNRALLVDRRGGSVWRGLKAMFLLGMNHIAEGPDHLLLLLMLLLPASLLSTGPHWTTARPSVAAPRPRSRSSPRSPSATRSR